MDQLSDKIQTKTDKNNAEEKKEENNSEKNQILNEKELNKEKTPLPSKVILIKI
jgi:hypothetical protein